MNDAFTDDTVITRLRSALDEAADGIDLGDADLIPLRASAPSPRRWIGIAAATVLLACGAVWALSTRATDDPAASPDVTIGTPTMPATTVEPLSPSTIAPAPHDGPWFALEMPGFEPGADAAHGATANLGEPHLFQAWEVRNGDVLGLLTVEIVPDGNVPSLSSPSFIGEPILPLPEGSGTLLRPVATSGAEHDYGYEFVWHRADGSTWWFRSAGLNWALTVKSVIGAVPGSGVPIVIPDLPVSLLTVGSLTGESISQAYGAAGDGVDDVAVVVTVVPDAATILELMGAANVVEVTVAGSAGYAALMDGGGTSVAWDAGDGYWGGLSISAAHARGADGIIAAVVPAAS